KNLLAHLSVSTVTDPRRARRPLTPDELRRLLQTTLDSTATYRELSARDRHFLYLAACVTGLRAGELASLKPESFALDTDPPTVTLAAGRAKNRKMAVQPLSHDVVDALRAYLAGRPAGLPVWPGTWAERAAEMFRTDLEAAGIAYVVPGPDGTPLHAD